MFDVQSSVASLRWQDIFDIALNSYILFRLYVLFRGTTTFRVLIVIALLWVVQRIATFLGLIVTSWVIQGITAVGALIIIIVLRNEIRSVLQAKNLKTILWGISTRVGQTPHEIIADSIFDLSKRRHGGLLVLPGKEDLSEFVQNGVPWHGLASREMITSIFWPDNPVHDGAAILKNDRITQVGVILPLSKRQDLPSSYGTRHRSAVGLAGETDALVIVVSEETGQVITTKGNQITRIRTQSDLVRQLEAHTGVLGTKIEDRKQEILKLATAAVVAVLFVISMWFSFSRGLESLTTIEVPIEYVKRDPTMEILDTSANNVTLNLSGSGTLIKSIRSENVKVRLDLSKAVIGSNTFTITPEDISIPPGIVLKKVTPAVIEVALDVLIAKELPVQVDWVGKLADDLILTNATVTPLKVKLIGERRILTNLSTVYTEKVSLDKIQQTGSMSVSLALNPASIKVEAGSTDKVTIAYSVKKRPAGREAPPKE
jgi:diadenylate cyclase